MNLYCIIPWSTALSCELLYFIPWCTKYPPLIKVWRIVIYNETDLQNWPIWWNLVKYQFHFTKNKKKFLCFTVLKKKILHSVTSTKMYSYFAQWKFCEVQHFSSIWLYLYPNKFKIYLINKFHHLIWERYLFIISAPNSMIFQFFFCANIVLNDIDLFIFYKKKVFGSCTMVNSPFLSLSSYVIFYFFVILQEILSDIINNVT